MLNIISDKKAAGVIWYQGESNSYAANTDYETKFKCLVSNFEADFGKQIPFITAQLNQVADTGYDQWLDVKEIQRQVPHRLSNVAVVVTNDLEMSDGIHNSASSSLIVAKRMADYALVMKYAFNLSNYKAPDLKQAVYKGNKILLEFDNLGGIAVKSESGEITDFFVEGATVNTVRVVGKNMVEMTVSSMPEKVLVSSINGAGITMGKQIIPTMYDSVSNLPILSFKVNADELPTGDCNIDNSVDIKDLVRLKKVLLVKAEESFVSDINCDGTVDSVDITLLKKMLMANNQ